MCESGGIYEFSLGVADVQALLIIDYNWYMVIVSAAEGPYEGIDDCRSLGEDQITRLQMEWGTLFGLVELVLVHFNFTGMLDEGFKG